MILLFSQFASRGFKICTIHNFLCSKTPDEISEEQHQINPEFHSTTLNSMKINNHKSNMLLYTVGSQSLKLVSPDVSLSAVALSTDHFWAHPVGGACHRFDACS